MKIGILAGSVLGSSDLEFPAPLDTEYGPTSTGMLGMGAGGNELLIIARHGFPPDTPPHRVNHRANVLSLKRAGVDCLISVCSTGALREDIKVPSVAIPGDYIDLFSDTTYHDRGILHVTPSMDDGLLKALYECSLKVFADVMKDVIYVQTTGPRLETRAEVRLLSGWGDVVGMNMGPEATLAAELDLRFGAILTVDNYANGVKDDILDFRDILEGAGRNWPKVLKILSLLPSDLL